MSLPIFQFLSPSPRWSFTKKIKQIQENDAFVMEKMLVALARIARRTPVIGGLAKNGLGKFLQCIVKHVLGHLLPKSR